MSDIVITVRGQHSARVTAERASVQVSASVDGPDRTAVVEQATALAAPLHAEVVAHADAGAVDTWSSDRVSVWADRPWNDRGEQLPIVHHATITVAATFTDATALSDWLSELALRDGVQIGGVDWSLSPETRVQIEREVATRAVGEAVRRATAYAQAIGKATVEAIELADVGLLGTGSEEPSAPRHAKAMMMDAGSPEIDLRPGEITVSAAVDAALTRRGSLPQTVAGAHGALGLALVLALADRLPLLELALALRDRDLDLRATVREVELHRDERVPARRHSMRKLHDLVLMQQELARALGGVVRPVPLRVLRDVHGVEPGLPAVDERVPVAEVRATLSQ
jgi:uncharacterized protein